MEVKVTFRREVMNKMLKVSAKVGVRPDEYLKRLILKDLGVSNEEANK